MAEKKTRAKPKASDTFTAEEKEAMRAMVKERRRGKTDGEADVTAAIAAMPDADRVLAERFHALVKAKAPGLSPRTWYGMPAWADAEGKVVCHFQGAHKFKTRYATIGFSDKANLDDGAMWPVVFALKKLGGAEEKRIVALIKQAVS
jgi:uncharacterized protein YdhG (YjbR/CyaY superfamily)